MTKAPEVSCIVVVVVARSVRPPRFGSGCRLEQSFARTWCRGKLSLVSRLKGKPSQVMSVATFSILLGQMKAVGSR